jgi:putative ABC transport system permease protein
MKKALVRLGTLLISLVFHAFPRAFREEYRADALTYFEDRAEEAARGAGPARILSLLFRSLLSVLWSGMAERSSRLLEGLRGGLADARYGIRFLRRRPGFVAGAAVTLAVGIAAVTAVMAVVDGVVLRPLPYDNPDELVVVGRPLKSGVLSGISTANAIDLQGDVPGFAAFGGVSGGTTVVDDGTEAVLVRMSRPTRGFLDVFHLRPALGRVFRSEDYHVPRVALVSWHLWQRRWGGDPSAIGSVVKTDLGELRVVGVLPPDWTPPEAVRGADGDIWIPTDYDSSLIEATRAFGFASAVGRLRHGVDIRVADAQLGAAARALADAHPDKNRENDGSPKLLEARDLRTQTLGDVRFRLLLLLGAVIALLGVACANAANLFLVRGMMRRRELALRSVMGAGRGRLSTQLLTESVVVSLLGGSLGTVLARLSVPALLALTPGLPRASGVAVDGRVAVAAMFLSILCGATVGLVPAFAIERRESWAWLRAEAGRDPGSQRLRGALVVGQTALAVVLVVGGGLMVNTAVRLSRVDPGVNSEGVVAVRPRLDPHVYGPDNNLPRFYLPLIDRLRTIPGITAVTGSVFVPGESLPLSVQVKRDDGGDVNEWRHSVLPDFFETLGIPILAGRSLGAQDRTDGERTAVVSATLARELWGSGSPLGHTLTANDGENVLTYKVVGVCADVRDGGPRQPAEGVFYESFLQNPWLPLSIMIRHAETVPATLASGIRQAIHEVDRTVPIRDIEPLGDVLGRHTSTERGWAVLLSVFSLAALLIAAVGVYATMSHTVALRLREMGVRRAVGAGGHQVAWLILARGMGLTLLGLVVGAGLALAATRSLGSLLFEISPSDPATYLAVGIVLLTAAAAACVLPALRASRANPVSILRSE